MILVYLRADEAGHDFIVDVNCLSHRLIRAAAHIWKRQHQNPTWNNELYQLCFDVLRAHGRLKLRMRSYHQPIIASIVYTL